MASKSKLSKALPGAVNRSRAPCDFGAVAPPLRAEPFLCVDGGPRHPARRRGPGRNRDEGIHVAVEADLTTRPAKGRQGIRRRSAMRKSLIVAALALFGLGTIVISQSKAFVPAPAQPGMQSSMVETVARKGTPPGWRHGRKVGWHGRHRPPGSSSPVIARAAEASDPRRLALCPQSSSPPSFARLKPIVITGQLGIARRNEATACASGGEWRLA
jgi:hypothetical protein